MTARCKFSINKDDEDYSGAFEEKCYIGEEDCNDVINEQEVWHCPRRSVANKDYCPFHIENSSSSISASEAFLNTITGKMYRELPVGERFCFHGSHFHSFSFENGVVQATNESDIQLKHCEFYEGINLEHLEIESDMIFSGSTFHREVKLDHINCSHLDFSASRFIGGINTLFLDSNRLIEFGKSDFVGEADFSTSDFESAFFIKCLFRSKANFIGTSISSSAHFFYARFEDTAIFSNMELGSTWFSNSSFLEAVSFENTTFSKDADFSEAILGKFVSFKDVVFTDEANFTNSCISGSIFTNAVFRGECSFNANVEDVESVESREKDFAVFNGPTIFKKAEFELKPDFRTLIGEDDDNKPTTQIPTFRSTTSFQQATFHRGGNFEKTNRQDPTESLLDFREARLENAEFSDSELEGCLFTDSNLSDTDFNNSNMMVANLERANLTRTNLFDVNLLGAKFYSAVLSDTQINNSTTFGAHYLNSDGVQEWEKEEIRKAMWSFRAVERLSDYNSLPSQKSASYRARKNANKALEKKEGDSISYLKSEISKHAWGYGSSIKQVAWTSIAVILGFGFLYPLIGGIGGPEKVSPTYMIYSFDSFGIMIPDNILTFLNSIYFSIVTFTTLGYGDLQPASMPVRIAASVESLIGNILLAAVIFVLGRRATR